MKKLLIIQRDESYFLFETLQVIGLNRACLKDFEITILVAEASLKKIQDGSAPLIKGITSNSALVLKNKYDLSFNLSLKDADAIFHSSVSSSHKFGPVHQNGQLTINDLWSSYFHTLKGRAPFLTFHLQDIFKNILGIKKFSNQSRKETNIHTIVIGAMAPHVFAPEQQEAMILHLSEKFPSVNLVDISEVDHVSDLTHLLYIGPATLDALKICEAGARGIFLGSSFQGFNLLPYGEGHLYISSRGGQFQAKEVLALIDHYVHGSEIATGCPYSVYRIEEEHIFGTYLKNLNQSDDNYPFYQSHVVLWNFVLNLFDTNLEIIKCSPDQLALLKQNQDVLGKLIRLYDYAMSAIDKIYHEAKSAPTDANKIQTHVRSLMEIETISDQISQSHPFLRPLLDYYRIRRGQNDGADLLEQSQISFLSYSEEHQALKALDELFSVTLRKNEVNI